jgi:hypothetical protein
MNKDLFDHIAKVSSPTHHFLVLISYLELYNENIHDLMNPDGKPLKIREVQPLSHCLVLFLIF